jgi:signal transduction histidine kinase
MAQSERPAPTHGKNSRRAVIGKLVHDMRNPVGGIVSASQYLIEDAGLSLDRQQRAMLASIEASGVRLLGLIEDLERWGKHSGKPPSSKEKPPRPDQSLVS